MFSSKNVRLQSFSDDPRNNKGRPLLSSSETARALLDSLFLFLSFSLWHNLTPEAQLPFLLGHISKYPKMLKQNNSEQHISF